jgi:hypothetical protein
MTTRTLTLILLAATLPASLAAQTESRKLMEVDQVQMRVANGATFHEAQVVLHFEADSISVRSANDAGPVVLKRVRYTEIESAEQPGRQLTIRCGSGTTVLRLHKSNQKRVRREIAKRSGVSVQTSYVSHGSFDWPAEI